MILLRTLLTVLFALGFYIGAMYLLDRGASALPKKIREKARVLVFVGPALLLVAVGLVIPALRTLMLSFLDNNNSKRWVGLENYTWIFTNHDGLITIRNNLLWVLIVPIVSTGIGLTVAVLADKYRGESLAKALIFLPNAISLAGAGIVWKFVYDYNSPKEEQIGVLNRIWVALGGQPIRFLIDNPPLNSLFLMVVMIWVQVGFATVILSAAIKGVPDDYMEAARIDGANERQVFWRILLPSIRPTMIVVLTTITIAVLKAFDIVKSMTGGNFDTDVVASALMTRTFSFGQYGYGAALAMILFLAVIPIMWLNVRNYRQEIKGR